MDFCYYLVGACHGYLAYSIRVAQEEICNITVEALATEAEVEAYLEQEKVARGTFVRTARGRRAKEALWSD